MYNPEQLDFKSDAFGIFRHIDSSSIILMPSFNGNPPCLNIELSDGKTISIEMSDNYEVDKDYLNKILEGIS